MPLVRRLLLLLLPIALACEVNEARTIGAGALCDPDEPQRCEGPDATCLDLGGGVGICTHACITDADCPASLTCRVQQGGTSARCEPGFRCADDTECPTGHRCDVAAGTCYIPVRRGRCAPCNADAQCGGDGVCFRSPATGERFCAEPCAAGAAACGAGLVAEWSSGRCLCVPASGTCEGGRPLCAPCTGDAQCGDGNDLCVKNFLSGERVCGLSCNPACTGGDCVSACPDGFRCSDLSGEGNGPFQCVPDAGSCAGWCSDDRSCPPGYLCDRNSCVPAVDGRACAPCADDDGCALPGTVIPSRCVANQASGESFCAPICADRDECVALAGPGFDCLPVGGQTLCIPAGGTCGGGVGWIGDPCGARGAAGCLSGVCLRDGDDGLCSARCDDDADCGGSWRCCARVDEGERVAWDCSVPPGPSGGVCAPAGGLFGDSCEAGRPPCQDGICLDIGTAQLCTATCTGPADCDARSGAPGSFVCSEARHEGGGPDDFIRVCFPAGGGAVGSDCTFGPAACSEQLCIRKQSGNVCTRRCDTSADCPATWSCGWTVTVDGLEREVCLPPTVASG